MRLCKILGAGTFALFLALAAVSCGNLVEPEATPSQAANVSNNGQTNDQPNKDNYISNIRFAVGADPSVVLKSNESNWNPKTVDFLEKVFIAFDVDTDIKIKSLKYIEILNNQTVLESQITANLNGSYKDGIGRIGNSLCLATVIDAGIGEFKYKIEVTFEDGTVSTITSNPIQVGKLSTANRASNLRVAPMIDTSDAWDILNTTGADIVEGEHGRIAFTVRNWSDTANIKNIYHVIWLKDNSGVYRRWWWTTTGIGNFGEKAWAKAANNSLYTPVLKPIGEVRYEVFVNFKDGTTERLEKEITSVAKIDKPAPPVDCNITEIRWGATADSVKTANKNNWNKGELNDGSELYAAVDFTKPNNVTIEHFRVQFIKDGKVAADYTKKAGEFTVEGSSVWARIAAKIGFSGQIKLMAEVKFSNGKTEKIYSNNIEIIEIKEKPLLSNFRFVAVEISDDKNANLVKEANRGYWNPATVRRPAVVLLAADVNTDIKIEKVLYTVYLNDNKVYEMSVGKGSESLGGDCNIPYQRQYLKDDYDGIPMYGRLGRVDNAFALDTAISGVGGGTGSKLQYQLTFTFANGKTESIFSKSTTLY